MNLYIGDTHFGHRAVLNHDRRPFESIEEHDQILIKCWNGRVENDDDVYIVGDFAYKNDNPAEWYLRQLRGRKHLVIGNHDSELLRNSVAMGYFQSVDKMMAISDCTRRVILCHYPLAEWSGFFRGSYHVYGHIHAQMNDAAIYMRNHERALNAGCMINNYTPASLDELIRNNNIFKQDF